MRMRVISAVLAIGGAIAAIAGGAGLLLKADPVVDVSAEVTTQALLIPPQMVAFAGNSDIVVVSDGIVDVYTGRPGDVEDVARYLDSSQLVGIASWEELVVERMWRRSDDGVAPTDDIYRDHFSEFREYRLDPGFFPVGESALVVSRPGEPIQSVQIELRRNVGYGWAWPALSGGALAMLVGLVMATIWWLDLRSVGARFEERTAQLRKRAGAKRSGGATAEPKSGAGAKEDTDKPAKKPRKAKTPQAEAAGKPAKRSRKTRRAAPATDEPAKDAPGATSATEKKEGE